MTLKKLRKCGEYLKDTWRLKFCSFSGRFGEEVNLLHLLEFKPLTIQPVAHSQRRLYYTSFQYAIK